MAVKKKATTKSKSKAYLANIDKDGRDFNPLIKHLKSLATDSKKSPKKAGSKALKKFSVLLLYPDYVSEGYGETYYTFVKAKDSLDAIKVAQKEVAKKYESIDNPEDSKGILVLPGHIQGLDCGQDFWL